MSTTYFLDESEWKWRKGMDRQLGKMHPGFVFRKRQTPHNLSCRMLQWLYWSASSDILIEKEDRLLRGHEQYSFRIVLLRHVNSTSSSRSYNNDEQHAIPTTHSKAQTPSSTVMIEWLRGLPFSNDLVRSELYQLARLHKTPEPTYAWLKGCRFGI